MFRENKAFSSFSAKNLQSAKSFYSEILGLDVKESAEGLQLQLAGGGEVFIYPKPNHTPATFTVLNFEVKDIERAVEDLRTRGVKFEIYKEGDLKTDEKGIFRGAGPKVAWFKDPAGNFLSILESN